MQYYLFIYLPRKSKLNTLIQALMQTQADKNLRLIFHVKLADINPNKG